MIGIIAAMQKEMDNIVANMTSPVKERAGGVDFIRGQVNGADVVCSVCGVGKVFAAMCAEAMIIKYAPSLVINTGVGGTLTANLTISDVAVSDRVCQHDMDTTALGDEPGLISGINKVYFDADTTVADKICDIAGAMGIKTHRGTIASGDRFIADMAEKKRIVDTFGAVCCEMEGAAVGHVCHVNEVPFVIIRAISDDADGGACDNYMEFAAAAATKSAAIVCELAGQL
ncbi:MAG: 5'-methylthioadenosine/adenosylhomocysteine nucleosidase [Clostridia bacterium]|nr:5'-methylthioadenosine/adenosylhomocysteine nucleosidase [Clostridia bacterium]